MNNYHFTKAGKAKFKILKHAFLLLSSFYFFSCSNSLPEKRVLIFSKTDGFRHASIPDAQKALVKLCRDNGIKADTTEQAEYFVEDSLKNYSAVIFLMTTGNVLDYRQQAHFKRYIQAGGGFVGIHSATDTEFKWPWFGDLVGAYFTGHPKQQNALVMVTDSTHASTKHLKAEWKRFDEWYNFRDFYEGINELAFLDESSYQGGTNKDYHPIAWYHEFDGGRSFYTGMGHTSESYSEAAFLDHVLGGINYAIGENTLNYEEVTAQIPPDESNFVKDVLVSGLNEPMELEIFDGDKVLFTQRGGELRLYDPENGLRTVAKIDVNTTFEDGLMGMAKDPNYDKNHWIYLYYAPAGEEWVNNLSRFVYIADSLLLDSEKIMLQVPVQRKSCCHTGGSIEFGPDGNLFLSTGDNTSPFNNEELTYNSDGYGPMNNLPEWTNYDARRSSANTQDLRGKVLRIKPNADGTYSIPDGNLFPKDGSKGRPEIFVMGCRNPYRISIDQKTGILYYGDVGPDANEDSKRGPRGYDEVNQVKQPGFFGWPLFIANNKPYARYDYKTGEIGEKYDPERPINDSPNNTGMRELPPAQPPIIYYPYAETKEFEGMGTGGRNAMAGPVYYSYMYKSSRYKLSSYYDGKFFFYDWIRDWIKVATFDENNNYLYHEPFLPSFKFSNIIDLNISEEGVIYILEYGENWFSKNKDATLSRILYSEANKIPVAKMEVDTEYGSAPLTVNFNAEKSYDFDEDDQLSYTWEIAGEVFSEEEMASYTFEKPGIYNVVLRASDKSGDFSEDKIAINVGNDIPEVNITIDGNKRFYWTGRHIKYAVTVADKEDGLYPEGKINASDIAFTFEYLPSHDKTMVEMGHQEKAALLDGAQLIENYNCFACHKVDEASVGPKYMDVADRYEPSADVVNFLAAKIINGGSGNWGEREMAANPSVSQEEAETMVKYILSLNDAGPSQPLQGNILLNKHDENDRGTYLLKATYTDKGANGISPLSETVSINLISNRVEAENFDESSRSRITNLGEEDITVVNRISDGTYLLYRNIDLTGVKSLNFRYSHAGQVNVQVKTGGKAGKMIAQSELPPSESGKFTEFSFSLNENDGEIAPLVIAFSIPEGRNPRLAIDWIEFEMGE